MAHRRDKDDDLIDLKLDKRQVSVLLVAALAVAAMVFFLGVVVGRRMAVTQEANQIAGEHALKQTRKDKLALLDEKAEAEKKGTTQAPSQVAGDHGQGQAAGDSSQQEIKEKNEAEVSGTGATTKEGESSMRRPGVKGSSTPATEKNEGMGTAGPGAFTLQVASVKKIASAKSEVKKLHAQGYKSVKVVEADLGRRGKWYRVMVGSFDTKEAAEKFKKEFERKQGIKGTLIKRIR